MTINLDALKDSPRLLFEIPLRPIQGQRFQPTGFPGLGAATFQTEQGLSLLVESAQSMANRLELTCWDEAQKDLRPAVNGLSHVRVLRQGAFLTDSIIESHRINSPYLRKGKDQSFLSRFKSEIDRMPDGPIDRRMLAGIFLKFDACSLIHGAFIPDKELKGGRLRVARALSAFIEANGVRVAASGGVKNDHVNPQGVTKDGFGNVPFSRDEYTAEAITLYLNLDLGQIRGYGLRDSVESMLILLSLYKTRVLIDGSLRFRTACDLEVDFDKVKGIVSTRPKGFPLPELDSLENQLAISIAKCRDLMTITEVHYDDELKKGKDVAEAEEHEADSGDGED